MVFPSRENILFIFFIFTFPFWVIQWAIKVCPIVKGAFISKVRIWALNSLIIGIGFAKQHNVCPGLN